MVHNAIILIMRIIFNIYLKILPSTYLFNKYKLTSLGALRKENRYNLI